MDASAQSEVLATETTWPSPPNVSNVYDILVQHTGYVSLGTACMLTNALALFKFFKEAKTHQYIGQRPLLLASIIADFLNGLTFTSAGGAELSRATWTPDAVNGTLYENSSALWASCVRTFYTPALVFLQAFMALVIVCTSIDRLTAVATPVFYAQCVKPRHCYMLLTLMLLASSASLAAAFSSGTKINNDTPIPPVDHWPASSCIAPFANMVFGRYFYGGMCSLITVSVVLDLLGLFSYKRMSSHHRGPYETSTRDYGVTNRNYLPRHAFGPSQSPSPTVNSVHPGHERRPSRQAFDTTTMTSGGCSVPMAMLATTLSVSVFFLVPCMFFWFASGIVSDEDARDRYGTGRRMAAYVAWGFLIYSLINSLIFFMIRKDLRKGLRLLGVYIRAYCRCLCMSLDPSAVCETTPVEVIGDPVASTASATTLSSLAHHPRMKKQRPSIVPLAYGTTEI